MRFSTAFLLAGSYVGALCLHVQQDQNGSVELHTAGVADWMKDMANKFIDKLVEHQMDGFELFTDDPNIEGEVERAEFRKLKVSDYEIQSTDDGGVRFELQDVDLDIKVYLRKLKFLKVPLLANKLLGKGYVEVKTHGDFAATWHKDSKGELEQKPKCDKNGEYGLDKLKFKVQLHVNPLINWSDKVFGWAIARLAREELCKALEENLGVFMGNKVAHAALAAVKGTVSWAAQMAETENLGKKCGRKGCSGGPCEFCGDLYCCKRGAYAGGCDGTSGGRVRAECVQPPSKPTELLHEGEECWNKAKCRMGDACGYCGTGICCRKGFVGGLCDGTMGEDEDNHTCTARPVEETRFWGWIPKMGTPPFSAPDEKELTDDK